MTSYIKHTSTCLTMREISARKFTYLRQCKRVDMRKLFSMLGLLVIIAGFYTASIFDYGWALGPPFEKVNALNIWLTSYQYQIYVFLLWGAGLFSVILGRLHAFLFVLLIVYIYHVDLPFSQPSKIEMIERKLMELDMSTIR